MNITRLSIGRFTVAYRRPDRRDKITLIEFEPREARRPEDAVLELAKRYGNNYGDGYEFFVLDAKFGEFVGPFKMIPPQSTPWTVERV